VGIVGLGNWGQLLAATLAGIPTARLSAVCDHHSSKRAAVLEAAGRIAGGVPDIAEFDSFEVFLSRADLDAVIIATQDDRHVEPAVAALQRGWHVFVEKPLALNWREAARVQDAAMRTGRMAMVGTILRFSLPHRQLADAVAWGRLGRLLHVRSVRHISQAWFSRTEVHPAFRTAIHDIDQVLWLTRQRVSRVAAAAHVLEGEKPPRALVLLMWLDGGASAVVEAHFSVPSSYPSNTLPPERPGARIGVLDAFGSAGMARLDDTANLFLWNEDGGYNPDTTMTPQLDGRIMGAMRAELEHFVQCAGAGRGSSIAPLEDTIHATAVAEAAIRAQASGAIETVEVHP
jgi:predicted dehydrogenase